MVKEAINGELAGRNRWTYIPGLAGCAPSMAQVVKFAGWGLRRPYGNGRKVPKGNMALRELICIHYLPVPWKDCKAMALLRRNLLARRQAGRLTESVQT
ncbi:hypothetical protein DMI62_05140 [Escherichia coli]|nr:hypothetical protein [Escherichia coli]